MKKKRRKDEQIRDAAWSWKKEKLRKEARKGSKGDIDEGEKG